MHQFVLDVQGMKCGGCSAAVKRILQQQDYIASAGVNLVTNTAAVGVRDGPDAQALARDAAALLTSKVCVPHHRDDGSSHPCHQHPRAMVGPHPTTHRASHPR